MIRTRGFDLIQLLVVLRWCSLVKVVRDGQIIGDDGGELSSLLMGWTSITSNGRPGTYRIRQPKSKARQSLSSETPDDRPDLSIPAKIRVGTLGRMAGFTPIVLRHMPLFS